MILEETRLRLSYNHYVGIQSNLRVTDACADDHVNYVPSSDEPAAIRIWSANVGLDWIWTCSCCGGCHRSLRPTLNGNRLDFQLGFLHLRLDW